MGRPSGQVNIRPELHQRGPTTGSSSAWQARCCRRAATVAGSRANKRRPLAVLGSRTWTSSLTTHFRMGLGRRMRGADEEEPMATELTPPPAVLRDESTSA
jgi:hypothetical protein